MTRLSPTLPIFTSFHLFISIYDSRFGKRSDAGVPTDPRFMLLQGSDDSVSRLSRPRYFCTLTPIIHPLHYLSRPFILKRIYDSRFGKRSDADAGVPTDSRYMLLQGSDDSISRLSRPRYFAHLPPYHPPCTILIILSHT